MPVALATLLVALVLLGSCSAPDSEAGGSATDADPPSGGPCASDFDCPGSDLCVSGTCIEACASFKPGTCPEGSYCDIHECFREHGCNPPPPGVMCSMICIAVCRPGSGE